MMRIRERFWTLCVSMVRWIIRTTLLLLLAGVMSSSILFVGPPFQRSRYTTASSKSKHEDRKLTPPSGSERSPNGPKHSSKNKNS